MQATARAAKAGRLDSMWLLDLDEPGGKPSARRRGDPVRINLEKTGIIELRQLDGCPFSMIWCPGASAPRRPQPRRILRFRRHFAGETVARATHMRPLVQRLAILAIVLVAALAPRRASALTLYHLASLSRAGVANALVLALLARAKPIFTV